MNKIFFILFAAAAFSLWGAGGRAFGNDRADGMWDAANTLYINGDYRGAIVAYETIAEEGYSGSKLCYNLGNAYFKDNKLGKAIVNYNRALRLSPADKDIQYNLAVATSYIKDRIEPVPELFINKWAREIRSWLSSNGWAVVSLVLLAGIGACLLVYILSQSKARRKAGFFTAAALVLLLVMSLSFAIIESRRGSSSAEAVLLSSAVSVKSSPDDAGKDLFIIHEGTKVEIVSRYGDWSEIVIANGSKGWLRDSAMEYI